MHFSHGISAHKNLLSQVKKLLNENLLNILHVENDRMNLLRTTALALVLTLSLANAMMEGDEPASASSQRVRNLDTVQAEINDIIAPPGTKNSKLTAIRVVLDTLGSNFKFNESFDEATIKILIGSKNTTDI